MHMHCRSGSFWNLKLKLQTRRVPCEAYLLSLECREFAIAYSLTLAGPPQTHSITKPVPAQSWAGSDVLAATFGSWASTTHDMGRIYGAIH